MTRRSLLLVLFLAMLAGAVALFILARPQVAAGGEEGHEPAIQLSVEPIQPERVVLEAELSGRVAAYRRVEIRPQVGGLILERHVEEGARVASGALLFRIDPAPLQADLDVAEAALARAVAAQDHARAVVSRSDALLDRNAVSREKNDTARNDLLLATASVAEARAVVERKRLDLEFSMLRSPVDGYVAAGLADIGGLATTGSEKPLAVLQELDKVYIDLRVPAADLDALLFAAEEGLGPVRIKSEQPGGISDLTGQLKYSDVIVDPATGNASIRVEVANPTLALLPGMFVRATLPRGLEAGALLVPEDAVLRKGDGTAQLVVVSDQGEARRCDVRLGDRLGTRILVTSGLTAGERVAIRGQDRVPDGSTIQVTILAAHAPVTDAVPSVPQP
ncbi:efflux RND transporter periplasmic adaptor subunit [Paracoccus sp. IB05]|uniref:efflux RND transporter periplasmic adaptor subunit n=1 Tax=Paracoccus sp. IB05 TaxID=2779367 RepID=UPI0018E860AA|nr:efflux RND transporter periplasmic adaptor subunit [Paracoccus sp. IB05]MBJ2153152.1 efflux RND transporter periplasmic adaptor subunit [Paracoccus sp. IB05]